MDKPLFSITCTTCHARLAVRNEEAIGAILDCPKCGSFVQVTPPEGWRSEAESQDAVAPQEESRSKKREKATAGTSKAAAAAALPAALPQSPAEMDLSVAEASEFLANEVASDGTLATATSHGTAAGLAWPGKALSATELLWRKWLVLGSASVAGLVVLVSAWSIFFSSDTPAPVAEPVVEQPQPPVVPEPAVVPDAPDENPFQRWLPNATTLLATMQPAQQVGRPNAGELLSESDELWRPALGAVVQSLGLKLPQIRRIQWAATDLGNWPHQSVVVIKLEPGHAESLRNTGTPVALTLADATCRQVPDGAWPHPFAVVDQDTVVTGHETLLTQLADRDELDLEDPIVERLLQLARPDAEAMVLIDLASARQADWQLPTHLFDGWPAGRQPWHLIWEVPKGIVCSWQGTDKQQTNVALLCEGETAAEELHETLEESAPAVRRSLGQGIKSLGERLKAGEIDLVTYHAYESLFKECLAASDSGEVEIDNNVVWLHVGSNRGPAALVKTALDFRQAIQVGRLTDVAAAEPSNDSADTATDNAGEAVPEPPSHGGPEEPIQAADDNLPELPPNLPELVPVDAQARLAQALPGIELTNRPLGEAVILVAAISGVPISFDPEAMALAGATVHDPVSVRLSNATAAEILRAVVVQRGLDFVVQDGQVQITLPLELREGLSAVRYLVTDLSGTDETATQRFAALMQNLVAPETWHARGGRGTIEVSGGLLVVSQTAAVHRRILDFCEKLRRARKLPLRSPYDPQRFELVSHRAKAAEALARPISANFHEPTPLGRILTYVAQSGGTVLLIDRMALADVRISDETPTTLDARGMPLALVLDELLRPLGLAYRVVDASTIQITSRKAAAARLELEFYPIGKLIEGGTSAPDLIERVRNRVASSTWSDAGGQGVIHFDEPSNCLIVLQSQPVQADVEQLLARP